MLISINYYKQLCFAKVVIFLMAVMMIKELHLQARAKG